MEASWPAAPRDFSGAEEIISAADAFPNSAGMQRRRLAVALQAGDAAGAKDAAHRLALMGGVLSEAAQAQVAALVGPVAMAPVSALMAANAVPVEASSLYAEVPPAHRLIEGLVWDRARHRLYATSVMDGALIPVGAGAGEAIRLQAGSLLGAAFDSRRRRLWIASAALDMAPQDGGAFAGLVSVDPDRPEGVVRVPAPEGATPGDVAVASDGTVYTSDGLSGAVYRCRPGRSELEAAVPPGLLLSAQGLALSPDQRLLYIADRRYGLAALDRRSGRLLRVRAPENVMLDGIDGLLAWRGGLIATQTAYAPARIVRLRLSPHGLSVTGLDVLERANPAWGEVTLMALVDDRLAYVADAQWEKFEGDNLPEADRAQTATPIRVIPLRRTQGM